MGNNDLQPEKCNYRGRSLSESISVCHAGQMNCSHRYSFGRSYYCSTRLRERTISSNASTFNQNQAKIIITDSGSETIDRFERL